MPDALARPRRAPPRLAFHRFAAGPFGGPQYVRAVAFPAARSVRPAYEVIFTASASNMTDVVVDAVTGKVLYRQPLTADDASGHGASTARTTAAASGPAGLVFLYYPGAPRRRARW